MGIEERKAELNAEITYLELAEKYADAKAANKGEGKTLEDYKVSKAAMSAARYEWRMTRSVPSGPGDGVAAPPVVATKTGS